MNYEYMVVYNMPSGSGRSRITRDKKIGNYEHLEELDNDLKKVTGFKELFVSNFILLRTYK